MKEEKGLASPSVGLRGRYKGRKGGEREGRRRREEVPKPTLARRWKDDGGRGRPVGPRRPRAGSSGQGEGHPRKRAEFLRAARSPSAAGLPPPPPGSPGIPSWDPGVEENAACRRPQPRLRRDAWVLSAAGGLPRGAGAALKVGPRGP